MLLLNFCRGFPRIHSGVYHQEEYGKEYRPPTQEELDAAEIPEKVLEAIADQIPYGVPDEALPKSDTSGAGRAFSVPLYGFKKWSDLFTDRQLLALMTFAGTNDLREVDVHSTQRDGGSRLFGRLVGGG